MILQRGDNFNPSEIELNEENNSPQDENMDYFKSATIELTCAKLNTLFWFPISYMLEHQTISFLSELYDVYNEVHHSICSFFKAQQSRWSNKNAFTLMPYQLYAYLRWKEIADIIEIGLFSFALIPLMIEKGRQVKYSAKDIPVLVDRGTAMALLDIVCGRISRQFVGTQEISLWKTFRSLADNMKAISFHINQWTNIVVRNVVGCGNTLRTLQKNGTVVQRNIRQYLEEFQNTGLEAVFDVRKCIRPWLIGSEGCLQREVELLFMTPLADDTKRILRDARLGHSLFLDLSLIRTCRDSPDNNSLSHAFKNVSKFFGLQHLYWVHSGRSNRLDRFPSLQLDNTPIVVLEDVFKLAYKALAIQLCAESSETRPHWQISHNNEHNFKFGILRKEMTDLMEQYSNFAFLVVHAYAAPESYGSRTIDGVVENDPETPEAFDSSAWHETVGFYRHCIDLANRGIMVQRELINLTFEKTQYTIDSILYDLPLIGCYNAQKRSTEESRKIKLNDAIAFTKLTSIISCEALDSINVGVEHNNWVLTVFECSINCLVEAIDVHENPFNIHSKQGVVYELFAFLFRLLANKFWQSIRDTFLDNFDQSPDHLQEKVVEISGFWKSRRVVVDTIYNSWVSLQNNVISTIADNNLYLLKQRIITMKILLEIIGEYAGFVNDSFGDGFHINLDERQRQLFSEVIEAGDFSDWYPIYCHAYEFVDKFENLSLGSSLNTPSNETDSEWVCYFLDYSWLLEKGLAARVIMIELVDKFAHRRFGHQYEAQDNVSLVCELIEKKLLSRHEIKDETVSLLHVNCDILLKYMGAENYLPWPDVLRVQNDVSSALQSVLDSLYQPVMKVDCNTLA